MTTKHWQAMAYASPADTYYIMETNGRFLFSCGPSVTKAEAQMIAAAPELLEALIGIMAISSASYPAEAQWFPNFDGVAFSRGSHVWDQAGQAIAKAEGHQ